MYLERNLRARLIDLAGSFPAVVVVGARQVGKSTLVQRAFKEADVVVFDPLLDVENARADPDLFLNNHRTPLILDEIQYAPECVPAIKRRIDRDRRPGQYILTGSQQWEVMKSVAESLAGRSVFLDLDGFSLSEITQAARPRSWLESYLDDPNSFLAATHSRLETSTTLFERIWRGFLPEAHFLPLRHVPDFHVAYRRTYIERDVRQLAEVSDWQLFSRFFRLCAALTAQEVNHSQLGRELGLTPQTSKRWLSMLKATFQWFEVPPYTANAVKRIAGRPKGYMGDTGTACAAQAISAPQAVSGHPLWGAMFETAVFGELRKLCAALSLRPNIFHWRAHSGAEVDFLIERNGVFHPIEVKAKSNPNRRDVAGIEAFRKAYPRLNVASGLLLAPTEKVLRLSEKDWAVPWDLKE